MKKIIQKGPTYDLKNDCFNGDTKIEQYLHYKYQNKGIDFDSIKPVINVYCQAYNILKCGEPVCKGGKNYNIAKDNLIYTGETMNSGLNILKRSMQLSSRYMENCKQIGVSGSFSNRSNIKKFIENLDKFHIEVNVKHLNKFLGLTHSIGNFIPVPEGFNVGRSLRTSDYWDLALYNIHLWYETKNDDYLNRFLPKRNENVIKYTKLWLDYYDNWYGFIEENYLQSFVSDDASLKPIPFWDEHFTRYEDYHAKSKGMTERLALEPHNMLEINQFLKNVNHMICARGELILKTLLNKGA